ncbi:MAG: PHB depolymerase family esterase [Agarilytica sp.]
MKLSRLNFFSISTLAVAAATAIASPAFAGWSSSQQNIGGLNAWVYTPADTGQDRSLMVVLHGCDQSNTVLKDWGNLGNAAENFNSVVVVPYRNSAWSGNASVNCWAYDEGDHIETVQATNAVANMTEAAIANTSFNIDAGRVYISGLSSGGGLSLVAGCARPDLFSAVDSIAGPTVGSDQGQALSTPIESTAISTGTSMCPGLAGSLSHHFDNQITHITWGQMDKDGATPGGGSYIGDPGQISLVSAVYSKANYKVMKNVYGTNDFGPITRVTAYGGAGADESSSSDNNGDVRVTYMSIDNVGHAWPAAKAGASQGDGGKWMAQHDMDYPSYILNWFELYNLRGNDKPEVVIAATSSTNSSASVDCTATDSDGSVVRVDSELLQNGAVIDAHNDVNNCDDAYTGLAEGFYKIRITATDNEQGTGSATTDSIQVGNPPDLPPVLSISGSVSAQSLTASGSVSDDLGLVSVTADLMQGGAAVSSQGVNVASDDSFSVTFNDVAEGTYQIRITAVDSGANSESATTDDLISQDLGSTGNLQFHIDEGHITFGVGYSSCFLEYGSSASFTMNEVDVGGGSCQWQDDNASCAGPTQACSGDTNPPPPPPPGDDCEDVTAMNYYHKTGGRAYSSGNPYSPDYFANGSDEAMPGSTYGSNTLRSFDNGVEWEVGSCP